MQGDFTAFSHRKRAFLQGHKKFTRGALKKTSNGCKIEQKLTVGRVYFENLWILQQRRPAKEKEELPTASAAFHYCAGFWRGCTGAQAGGAQSAGRCEYQLYR